MLFSPDSGMVMHGLVSLEVFEVKNIFNRFVEIILKKKKPYLNYCFLYKKQHGHCLPFIVSRASLCGIEKLRFLDLSSKSYLL